MKPKRFSMQWLVVVFVLLALALQSIPLWLISLNRIENVPQFTRTIVTLAISTAFTIGIGSWLFMGVTRRLTRRLESSEKLHREVLRSISSPVLALDRELQIQYCSSAFASIVGSDPEQLVGKKLLDVAPGFEKTLSFAAYIRVLRSGESEQISGKFGEMDLEVRIWRSPDGIVAIASDVTERERLLHVTRRLAAIVDTSDDAIMGLDAAGRITDWNKGAERIYLYSAAEILGQHLHLLATSSGEVNEMMEQVSAGQTLRHLQAEHINRQGKALKVELTVTPTKSESGEIVGASCVARDVTAITHMESELAAAREARAALQAIQSTAATAAHEINNPLAAQMLLLEVVREDVLGDKPEYAEARELLEQGLEQSRRIRDAVERLQDISQPHYKAYIGGTKILDIHDGADQAQQ
ncbi:MAG: PAS domain S-box protein [bacterium]|nr:PAS domain S-box protein [bacterium]